ncbi:MAG: sensor histidine kinase [Anaerolineales bacterium]|nr:sensor histidine kinase [Anaerolineales bacterium]
MFPSPGSPSPTRLRPVNAEWYGWFWTVVTVLMYIWAFWIVFDSARPYAWLVATLLTIQLVMYIRAIALSRWPVPNLWLAAYFIPGPIMWAVCTWFDPRLWWMGMMYFGQMWGCLPPKAAVPGTAIIMLAVLPATNGWRSLEDIPPSALLGFGFGWIGMVAVYLWISQVIRSSDERARLIRELESANHELVIARERESDLSALRERERLARDLHDTLGHTLSVMSVQLEAIQRLYRVDPERGSEHIDELKTLTRDSMSELRRSLDGLRAPGLGERQLVAALQDLGVAVGQRAGITVHCEVDPGVSALTPALAETVWRVAQEALANVEKHARARSAAVRVSREPQSVRVTISDDGVGLPADAEGRRGHYGLRGLRERVEGLGGVLTLARLQPGSRVEALLPVYIETPAAGS